MTHVRRPWPSVLTLYGLARPAGSATNSRRRWTVWSGVGADWRGKFSCSNERWHRQCIIRSEGLHRGDLMHSPHRSTLVSASLRSAPAKSRSCSPGSPPTRRRSQLDPSTFRWARSTRTSPEFDRSTPLWAAARRRRPPFSHVRSRTVTLTCPSGESRFVTSLSDRRVESAPRFWIPDSDRRRLSQTGALIRPFEVRRHNHIGR
jgi:hypothetical protein